MSLLVTAGLLIVAIILLIVTFVFATDALWQLGIANLFKEIGEVFDGKNKGETATDYLVYAMIISGTLLAIFVLLIIVAIILVIVGGVALGAGAATGVDEAGLAVAGVAEGGEAAAAAGEAAVEAGEAAEGEAAASEGPSFLSKIGNLLNSWVGTVLMIVLVIVIFTSSASGAFCFLAAAEIRKEPKYDGDSKLKNAYEDAVVAGIAGVAVAVFSVMAIIGYYSYKHYRKQKLLKAERLIEQAKEQKLQAEARGLIKLEKIRAGGK